MVSTRRYRWAPSNKKKTKKKQINIMFECFFFKRKTAYKRRISNLSSDVFSSDLEHQPEQQREDRRDQKEQEGARHDGRDEIAPGDHGCGADVAHAARLSSSTALRPTMATKASCRLCRSIDRVSIPAPPRSEEHTSELQSLMRISYAVFCLKKKKQ